jgi:mono/diheme cytochrome c family protein
MASRNAQLTVLGAAFACASAVVAWQGGAIAQAPIPAPPQAAASLTGRDSFDFYCASCHGASAQGNGPLAEALRTPPANLTELARRNGGVFPRERVRATILGGSAAAVAAHGTSEMPVWGPIFRAFDPSDTRVGIRVDNIVAYLESLQRPSEDSGDRLFATYCASCHGANARGSGPVADALRRVPPDLTTFTARNGGRFPAERLQQIIDGRTIPSHGSSDMPIWGDAFKSSRTGFSEDAVRARIAAIVRFLESIQVRSGD